MDAEDVGVAIAGALISFAAALQRHGIDANVLLTDTANEIAESIAKQPETPARAALHITTAVLMASEPG
ncbi:hypothetical protein [Xanthobacter flavus]|uniref:hypothetical protein n=1 Tax=Xanthobacter flavus TaxID=281 RepID=UPI003728AB34